jgi:hypothetical protein
MFGRAGVAMGDNLAAPIDHRAAAVSLVTLLALRGRRDSRRVQAGLSGGVSALYPQLS